MKLVKDKAFYRNILAIAIPIALQNLISYAVNLADVIMLGIADKTEIMLSAVNLANQPFFILSLFVFGMSGAGAVLASQYWGKKDMHSVRIVISMVLKISIIVAVLFMLAILIFPMQIMSIFTPDQKIIASGVEYLQVMGYAYLFFGISSTLICSLRSVELVKISVVVSVVSLITNVSLNWILIFGNLGFPAMGIRGAAIATLTARVFEFIIVCVYVFIVDKRLGLRVRHIGLFNKTLFIDLMKHGSPVCINELMWSLGMSTQAVILGHITYSAGNPIAANSIASNVQQLATVLIFGVANSAAVLIGKAIGEGNKEMAMQRAATYKLIALLLGLASCGVILVLREPIVGIFQFTPETIALAKELLVVIAFNVIFVSFSSIYIVGILRGAGDTRFCLIAEIISLWGVATPLAALLAFVFHVPVPIVLLGMRIDEVIKAIACLIRTIGDKWVKIVTREKVETITKAG